MRQTFTIVTTLALATTGVVTAQDAIHTEPIQVSPLPQIPAEDAARQTGVESQRHECSSCAVRPVNQCSNSCCANRRLIIRRYIWIPAACASIDSRVVATGFAVSRVAAGHARVGHFTASPGQYSGFSVIQNSPLVTGGYAHRGFATGQVAVQPTGIGATGTLPASPYSYHPSYAAYSQAPVTASRGGYVAQAGWSGAAFSNVPVYPTAQFRRTSGFIAPIPFPHYSAY
jgi:hypothetical protein